MTPQLLPRSWRAARAASLAVVLTAAALTGSGAATHGADQPTSGPAASTHATAPCLTKASAQRVRADSGADGVDPNDLTLAQTRRAQAGLTARLRERGLSLDKALPRTTIDVYVHVITRHSGSGGVSSSRIRKQIAVLNDAYAGKTSGSSTKTAFAFRLKDTDKTKSSDWYDWSDPGVDASDDVQAKTALHRGGFGDLNLYVTGLGGGLLGYATFPFATTLPRDGVVVLNASLPGGSARPYDRGDTATHEVGHWLGLLHTFENGCASPGDQVDDTPYQADGDNIFSCRSTLDTCRSAGRDPVHNFMSYGDDKCLSRFTPGQAARMAQVWQAYRAPGSAG
jgi:Pregnancy-associated plasma protein-A